MAINNEELKAGLEKDLIAARYQAQQASTSSGVKKRPADGQLGFEPTSIRIGKTVIGQEQFARLKEESDKAINELAFTSQMKGMQEEGVERNRLSNQMSQLKALVLKSGLSLDKQLLSNKLKQNERMALIQGLAGTAKGLGTLFVLKNAGIGSSGETTPTE